MDRRLLISRMREMFPIFLAALDLNNLAISAKSKNYDAHYV
jgi:hypothetical protein